MLDAVLSDSKWSFWPLCFAALAFPSGGRLVRFKVFKMRTLFCRISKPQNDALIPRSFDLHLPISSGQNDHLIRRFFCPRRCGFLGLGFGSRVLTLRTLLPV